MTTMLRAAFALLLATLTLISAAHADAYLLPTISEEGGPVAKCNPGYALTRLKCTGSYCDNIQGTCTKYAEPPALRSTGTQYWTDWYSEEKSQDVLDDSNFPALKDSYSIAVGLQCRGRYCDDMRFLMQPMRGANSPTMDSKSEYPVCRRSTRFSEEQSNPPAAAQPYGKGMEFIRRAGCSGRYCDNLQVEFCKIYFSGWRW